MLPTIQTILSEPVSLLQWQVSPLASLDSSKFRQFLDAQGPFLEGTLMFGICAERNYGHLQALILEPEYRMYPIRLVGDCWAVLQAFSEQMPLTRLKIVSSNEETALITVTNLNHGLYLATMNGQSVKFMLPIEK